MASLFANQKKLVLGYLDGIGTFLETKTRDTKGVLKRNVVGMLDTIKAIRGTIPEGEDPLDALIRARGFDPENNADKIRVYQHLFYGFLYLVQHVLEAVLVRNLAQTENPTQQAQNATTITPSERDVEAVANFYATLDAFRTNIVLKANANTMNTGTGPDTAPPTTTSIATSTDATPTKNTGTGPDTATTSTSVATGTNTPASKNTGTGTNVTLTKNTGTGQNTGYTSTSVATGTDTSQTTNTGTGTDTASVSTSVATGTNATLTKNTGTGPDSTSTSTSVATGTNALTTKNMGTGTNTATISANVATGTDTLLTKNTGIGSNTASTSTSVATGTNAEDVEQRMKCEEFLQLLNYSGKGRLPNPFVLGSNIRRNNQRKIDEVEKLCRDKFGSDARNFPSAQNVKDKQQTLAETPTSTSIATRTEPTTFVNTAPKGYKSPFDFTKPIVPDMRDNMNAILDGLYGKLPENINSTNTKVSTRYRSPGLKYPNPRNTGTGMEATSEILETPRYDPTEHETMGLLLKYIGFFKDKFDTDMQEYLKDKDTFTEDDIKTLKEMLEKLTDKPTAEDMIDYQAFYDTLKNLVGTIDNLASKTVTDASISEIDFISDKQRLASVIAALVPGVVEGDATKLTGRELLDMLFKNRKILSDDRPATVPSKQEALIKKELYPALNEFYYALVELYENVSGAVRVYIRTKDAGYAAGDVYVTCEPHMIPFRGVRKPIGKDHEQYDYTQAVEEIRKNEGIKKYIDKNKISLSLGDANIEFGPFYKVIANCMTNKQLVEQFALNMKNFVAMYDKFKIKQQPLNLVFFTYGLSGSGKTYTLFNRDQNNPKNQGIVYQMKNLFKRKNYELEFADYCKIYGYLEGDKFLPQDNRVPSDASRIPTYKTDISNFVAGEIETDVLPKTADYDKTELVRSMKVDAFIKSTPNNPQSSRGFLIMWYDVMSEGNKIGKLGFIDMAGNEDPYDLLVKLAPTLQWPTEKFELPPLPPITPPMYLAPSPALSPSPSPKVSPAPSTKVSPAPSKVPTPTISPASSLSHPLPPFSPKLYASSPTMSPASSLSKPLPTFSPKLYASSPRKASTLSSPALQQLPSYHPSSFLDTHVKALDYGTIDVVYNLLQNQIYSYVITTLDFVSKTYRLIGTANKESLEKSLMSMIRKLLITYKNAGTLYALNDKSFASIMLVSNLNKMHVNTFRHIIVTMLEFFDNDPDIQKKTGVKIKNIKDLTPYHREHFLQYPDFKDDEVFYSIPKGGMRTIPKTDTPAKVVISATIKTFDSRTTKQLVKYAILKELERLQGSLINNSKTVNEIVRDLYGDASNNDIPEKCETVCYELINMEKESNEVTAEVMNTIMFVSLAKYMLGIKINDVSENYGQPLTMQFSKKTIDLSLTEPDISHTLHDRFYGTSSMNFDSDAKKNFFKSVNGLYDECNEFLATYFENIARDVEIDGVTYPFPQDYLLRIVQEGFFINQANAELVEFLKQKKDGKVVEGQQDCQLDKTNFYFENYNKFKDLSKRDGIECKTYTGLVPTIKEIFETDATTKYIMLCNIRREPEIKYRLGAIDSLRLVQELKST